MTPLLEVFRCRAVDPAKGDGAEGKASIARLRAQKGRMLYPRPFVSPLRPGSGPTEGVPDPGLVQGVKFQQRPTRYGRQGLTNSGRKRVLAGCRLLESDRRLLSFWTVTLPDAAISALKDSDGGVPDVQEVLRAELERLLRRRGLSPEAVGVAEIQPDRLKKQGVFAPHWHVVFRGRRTCGHAWAISRHELDQIIAIALHRVTGVFIDCSAAGNVQQVRKSVAAYLGRYMKKGISSTAQGLLDQAPDQLVPKQWWLMTNPLRKALLSRTFVLEPDFLKFVDRCQSTLESLGFLRVTWHLKEDTHIWINRVLFFDLNAFEKVLDLYKSEAQLLRDLKGDSARPGVFFMTNGLRY